MSGTGPDLQALGWSDHFAAQIDADHEAALQPARVTGVQRQTVTTLGAGESTGKSAMLALPGDLSAGDLAVGDWLLADPVAGRVVRLLDRKSRIARQAAGDGSRAQLIVANVDTVFLTTSCTEEFNEARLERYLSLAYSGGVPPVFVLTKPDLTDDPQAYLERLAAIAPSVPSVLVNAKVPGAAGALDPWCGPGRTVAFLGMSGVGKSTLAAALTGLDLETGEVREDDMKGRHTTTTREMHPIPGGGWLIDTPGMRELRLAEMADGIDETFAEITDLAADCRFADCRHESEPGCAVQAALAAGRIDAARLARWRKLKAEDAQHSASAADRRKRARRFTKSVRRAKQAKSARRTE